MPAQSFSMSGLVGTISSNGSSLSSLRVPNWSSSTSTINLGTNSWMGMATDAFKAMQSGQGQNTTQANSDKNNQVIDQVAQGLSNIPGGFGTGVSLGYSGVKTLTAPYLAYRAAKQERSLLQIQADLQDTQASIYQSAAEDVLRAGQQHVAALTYQLGQNIGTSRVAQAAAGVHVAGSGSMAEVLADQRITTEIQVNQILANAITASFGYQRAKVGSQAKALAYRSARGSISPWVNAMAAHLTAVNEGMGSVMGAIGSMKGGAK